MYLNSWLLLAASIPLSKFTTSVFVFTLAGSWILIGEWKEKWNRIQDNKIILFAASSLFLLFVLGLWNTTNFWYAFNDLKVKLPLFVLPFLLISGPLVDSNHVKKIFAFIIAGAICSAFIGFIIYHYRIIDEPALNYRELSPFISHIRLSLMLCFSLAYFFDVLLKSNQKTKWLLLIPSLFTLYYLNLIHSLSSFVLLFLLAFYFLIFYKPWKRLKLVGYLSSAFLVVLLTYTTVKFYGVYQEVFQKVEKPVNLELKTINGNDYLHDTIAPATENGNYVGLYICYPEIYAEWEKRSEVSLDSVVKFYPLKTTLIRYLTSKGLRKDSAGIAALDEVEISGIEKGIANVYYLKDEGIRTRIHQTLWEIKKWEEGASTEYNSVGMRLFFWKNALQIIANNFYFGTGTGDIQDEIKKEFEKSRYSYLQKTWRSHNQYLTVAASLGIFSLVVFLIALFYPIIQFEGKYKAMNTIIGIIICTSMLWEDTLETQAGVCLTGLLLYTLSIAKRREKQVKKYS